MMRQRQSTRHLLSTVWQRRLPEKCPGLMFKKSISRQRLLLERRNKFQSKARIVVYLPGFGRKTL
jgi:hypothetical protein